MSASGLTRDFFRRRAHGAPLRNPDAVTRSIEAEDRRLSATPPNQGSGASGGRSDDSCEDQPPALDRRWTIGVTYDARDDSGRLLRVRSCIWIEADDIRAAYGEAERAMPANAKLGAILPGWHAAVGML